MSPGDCAGPASHGPVPGTVSPPSPDLVQEYAARAALLIGQVMGRVMAAIQQDLAAGQAELLRIGTRVATPIVAGLTAGQGVIDQIGGNVKLALSAAATPPMPSGAAGSTGLGGTYPGQYTWNMWTFKQEPYPSQINPTPDNPDPSGDLWCFRGSWHEYMDAVAYYATVANQRPPPGCYGLGGPATPPPQTIIPCNDKWSVYQLFSVSPTGPPNLLGCEARCDSDPAPPNSIVIATGLTDQQKNDVLASADCKPPPPPPPPPPPADVCTGNWYYIIQGQGSCYVMCYLGVGQLPNQNRGPYQTKADATAAMLADPLCGGQVVTPPGSQCPPISLPDCIKIDLCDWEMFRKTMCKILGCDCPENFGQLLLKLADLPAYYTEDQCDKPIEAKLVAYAGSLEPQFGAASIDEVLNSVWSILPAANGSGFLGPDPFPR